MHRFTIAFLAGALATTLLPAVPDITILVAVSVAVVLVGLWWRSLGLLALVLGCLWTLHAASQRMEDRLDRRLEGRDLMVSGTILTVETSRPGYLRFQLAPQMDGLPRKIRLSWYAARMAIEPGQVWRFRVRLWRPRGMLNPGGRDFEARMLRLGIGAVGYVRGHADAPLAEPFSLRRALWRLRQGLDSNIETAVSARPGAAVIRALVTGMREDIPAPLWRTMEVTGTVHLMAISGLHVGIVALAGFALAGRMLAIGLAVPVGNRRIAATVSGWICAAFYAALAGFSLPTVRALIMLGVYALAVLIRREMAAGSGLCAAALIVLLLDPLAVLGVGFWLSFGAVSSILWGFVVAERRRGKIRAFLHAQAAVTLLLAPVLIHWRGELPVSSVLANVLAVPLFSFVVVPGALVATLALFVAPAAGSWGLQRLAGLIEWFIDVLGFLAVEPMSVPAPGILATAAMVVGAVLLVGPAAVPARRAGLALLGLPLLAPPPSLPVGAFEMTAFDVGQGLAVLIRTKNHAVVYDTGPSFRSGRDAASTAVLPALSRLGVHEVDLLVLSHSDDDHAGGARAIVERFPAVDIVASQRMPGIQRQRKCERGLQWFWDDVRFTVLHPPVRWAHSTDNDASCVLRVESVYGSVLLTGDVERVGERALLGRPRELDATVVIAPHHGSRTSSSAALVAATSPDWVVFAAGARNRWGFPAPEVAARWRRAGAQTLQTGRDGAISVRFQPDRPPEPTRERERNRRIWREP